MAQEESQVRKTFWQWVSQQDAGDGPRGDFMRDTQDCLSQGLDPDMEMTSSVSRAKEEHDLLWREYAEEIGIPEDVITQYLLADVE